MAHSKPSAPAGADLEQVHIDSVASLDRWFERHHTQAESVWIVTWKKASGGPHVAYSDVVDTALTWGWIDSLPRKLDDKRSMLLVSPRRPGSGWSKVNKDKVARLTAAGRMRAPGLAAIERAKANGAWSKLDAVDALAVPPDLAAALRQVRGATAAFDAFPRSNRRGILEWIAQAKRSATRARRIEEVARLAGLGLRALHPESRNR
jgi:uncharacterized protein YdeI (YjbR/CyaY-like superfamily)